MKIRSLFFLLFFVVSCAYSDPIIVGNFSVTVKTQKEMSAWRPTFSSWLDWFYFIRGNDFIQGLAPKLIYKSANDKIYTAVFLDEKGSLVVAEYSKQKGEIDTRDTDVSAKDDPSAIGHPELRLVRYTVHRLPWMKNGMKYSASNWSNFEAGTAYTIKPEFKGDIHIYKERWKSGDTKRHVEIDTIISWPPAKFLSFPR